MRYFLVTGGAGFIGSNLIKNLLSDGNNHVICLDNFDPFYSTDQKQENILPFKNHPNFEFSEGDIRDIDHLKTFGQIDVIVHLAAKAGVRQSISQPELYFDVNVNGTQNLLNFAKERGIKQFVFASSSSVYGINTNVPWNEHENLIPISPYASTKLMGEFLGQTFSKLHEIRFIALRFFTVYGPGQRPDLAIHKFYKAIQNGDPISVYGDGSTRRDYTFVDDTVQGILAAIDYRDSDFEIINIGNNRTVTLKELIKAIELSCGKKAVLNYVPEQEGDVPQTYADIRKASALLDYHPNTKLQEGLQAFANWLKQKETVPQ